MERHWTYPAPVDGYWAEGAVSSAAMQLRLMVERLVESENYGNPEARSPLSVIKILRWVERTLELEYAFLIAQARVEGASWSQIAEAFRLSKQAVQQRFGEPVNMLLPYCTAEGSFDFEGFLDMLDAYYTGRRSLWEEPPV